MTQPDFSSFCPPFAAGSVWIGGAGTGDMGLITLHLMDALRRADAVLYDSLVNTQLLQFIHPNAETIFVGKRRGARCVPTQESINQCLIAEAKAGKRVLRLKGGDPLVFARSGEELTALAHHAIPTRIIPGISSVTAACSYAGIPLTHRLVNASVMMITGHDKSGDIPQQLDWHIIARASPVLVFFMALSKLTRICDLLIENGRDPDEPAAVIAHATTPQQKVIIAPLNRLARRAADLTPPSLVIVGEVINHRQEVIPVNSDGATESQSLHHSLHHPGHLPRQNPHFVLQEGEKLPYFETNAPAHRPPTA